MTALDTTLLSTKLYVPPPRPGHVPRPRLVERLDDGVQLGRKLTIVSAPAGYGKTTLIGEWISQRQGMAPPLFTAWLSLDEGDNDPARFFAYLAAALQAAGGGLVSDQTGGLERLLQAPQMPPLEQLIAALINDVAAAFTPPSAGTLLLVLDDYHAITELAIHEAAGLLLERQPPQMHLAITTRQDPPLPLARLRGRGQVTEFRESDLYFTPDQAATFLNQSMGLDLPASDIATLEARTEGWIAGLQMAALALQGIAAQGIAAQGIAAQGIAAQGITLQGQAIQSSAASPGMPTPAGYDPDSMARFITGFSGRHHFVLDYLTDEVLAGQPQPVQTFLLQTSILERITAPLCDALLPDLQSPFPNTQALLEHLDAANLFIHPLDDERRWYRYHRLFADLLQARLQEAYPDLVPELHRRAATWYKDQGLAAGAVRHALATQDAAWAAGVITGVIGQIDTWTRIDAATYLRWVDALPSEVVRSRPRLRLFVARALYATGQAAEAERILEDLEGTLRAGEAVPEAEGLLQPLAADRASFAVVRGDLGQGIAYAQRALADLPQDDKLARLRPTAVLGLARLRAGDVVQAEQDFRQAIATARSAGMGFAAVPLACNLAEAQMIQGQLQAALQTCQQAREMAAPEGRPTTSSGFVDLVAARVRYEWNELPAAERHVRAGLEQLSQSGIPASFGLGHALLAQIGQALGDPAGARAAMSEAVRHAQASDITRIALTASALQARLWLDQGHVERAAAWASDYRQAAPAEYLREVEDLILARVLLAEDKAVDALDLLDRLLAPALSAGRLGRAIEIQALRALAIAGAIGQNQALESLEWAMRLAEPEGYVRIFVDEGAAMAQLLEEAARRGIAPDHARRLLSAFEASGTGAPSSIPRSSPASPGTAEGLVEPLTPREIEVLHLLSEGLTNPEIARQLIVSLPTVKSHARNIYGKLGVHGRREAVARARQLGIL